MFRYSSGAGPPAPLRRSGAAPGAGPEQASRSDLMPSAAPHHEQRGAEGEQERARDAAVAARRAAAATAAAGQLAERGAVVAVGEVAVVALLGVDVDLAVAALRRRRALRDDAEVVDRPAAELEARVR